MVLQSLGDMRAIEILSMIVRFHLVSSCRLAGLSVEKFDPHINTSHQLDCLKDLLLLQAKNDVSLSAREEMAALYLLTNLTASAARLWALEQPDGLRKRPLMSAALQLAAAVAQNNYVRFTRLLHGGRLATPYRLAARRTAANLAASYLRVLSVAHSSPACRYPLAQLAGRLRLEPGALRQLCESSGNKIVEEEMTSDRQVQPGKVSIQFSRGSGPSSSVPADLWLTDSCKDDNTLLSVDTKLFADEWRSFVLGSSK